MRPKSVWMSLTRPGWHFSPGRLALSGTLRPGWLYNCSSTRRASLKRASRKPNSTASKLAIPWRARLWRTMFKKAALSWNCSWATSCGWSFFFCRGLIAQAGDLVAQGDKGFGHRLEVSVIFHILLHLGGLVLGDALGALFAVEETLKDVIRALR